MFLLVTKTKTFNLRYVVWNTLTVYNPVLSVKLSKTYPMDTTIKYQSKKQRQVCKELVEMTDDEKNKKTSVDRSI